MIWGSMILLKKVYSMSFFGTVLWKMQTFHFLKKLKSKWFFLGITITILYRSLIKLKCNVDTNL